MSAVIRVTEVRKLFRRMAPGFKMRTLKSALLGGSLLGGIADDEAIAALEGVSFEVEAGQSFGVIGSNGSGKSTLLKLVAGMMKPTEGTIVVDGRVAAMIELGAGFHPEISGRENIFINGTVLGLSRKEIAERFDQIVDFAGLEDFIDEPVKNYSSGMYVRLGFAVAVHTDPDVLLVDEVLAVGDEAFAHRCLRRIEEMLARGCTLMFVSHSLALVEALCDRVLWLEKGSPKLMGSPRRVIDAYRMAVAEEESEVHRQEKEEREVEKEEQEENDPVDPEEEPDRWGSGLARIHRAWLTVGENKVEQYHFKSGQFVTIELDVEADSALDDFVFGVAINTPRGVECWGTNTDLEGFVASSFRGRGRVSIECPHLRLAPGEYHLDLAVHSKNGAPYDYHRGLLKFSVRADQEGVGIYFPEHSWRFSQSIQWTKE